MSSWYAERERGNVTKGHNNQSQKHHNSNRTVLRCQKHSWRRSVLPQLGNIQSFVTRRLVLACGAGVKHFVTGAQHTGVCVKRFISGVKAANFQRVVR